MALMLGSNVQKVEVTYKTKKEEKPSESKDEKKAKDTKAEDKKKVGISTNDGATVHELSGPEKHIVLIGTVLLAAARILGLVTTWHMILLFLGLLLIAAIISIIRDPEKLRDTVVWVFCILALVSVIVIAGRIVGFSGDLFMNYIRSITN